MAVAQDTERAVVDGFAVELNGAICFCHMATTGV